MSYNALSRGSNPLPAGAVLPLFAASGLRKQGERNRGWNWSFWELGKFFGMAREELDNVHFMGVKDVIAGLLL